MTFVDQIKKIGRILGVPVAGSNIADCLNSLEISVTNKMVSEGKKIDTKALSKIDKAEKASPVQEPVVVSEPAEEVSEKVVTGPVEEPIIAAAPSRRSSRRSRSSES